MLKKGRLDEHNHGFFLKEQSKTKFLCIIKYQLSHFITINTYYKVQDHFGFICN